MLSTVEHHPRSDAAAAYADDWIADHPRRRSLETLQLTLNRTTETLALALARPDTRAPEWSETEWAVARAVAAIHGISPLLARTVYWPGPDSWRRFLEAQTAHTARRFLRIERLLQLIDERTCAAAIPVVPLKGAALHALGVYAPGERPMADIDLLVREEHSSGFTGLLAGLGFAEIDRTWKHRVFARADDRGSAALGEHADNSITIELHCRIAEALPHRRVDVTASVLPDSPRPGFNSYASRAALLLHVLLHAAGAMVLREVRLLQLHDIARLAAAMSAADWEQLSRLAGRSLWWAFPPLALANRYFECVPEPLLRRAAADCHWTLKRTCRRRTLAQVSLSHLWISAFPGIAWARSPGETLAYAAARTLPDGEPLWRRRTLPQSAPGVSNGRWSQLSQAERIVRWMVARQARHATLQPVRAALRGAPA